MRVRRLGDEDAAAGLYGDKTNGLERAQSFPERRSADFQTLGKLSLSRELIAGPKLLRLDHLPELLRRPSRHRHPRSRK
jgi:hypothetical protein